MDGAKDQGSTKQSEKWSIRGKEDGEARAPERLHSQTRRRNSGGRTEKYDHVLDQGKNPTSPGVFVRSGLSPKETLTGPSLTQASFFALNL